MSFYFQPALNGVTLSALLCVHSQKIKKEERGSSDHSVLVNIVSCSFQKGSLMNNRIFLCFCFFFFLILCLYILTLEPLYFSTGENGTQYIYSADYPWTRV